MLFNHFITSFIVSSISIGGILLIRKLCANQLSAKWQYNLWFLLFIALTLPLIPQQLIPFEKYAHFFNVNPIDKADNAASNFMEESELSGTNWMEDFTISVNHLKVDFLETSLTYVWLAGMIILTMLFLHAWFKLKKIKTTAAMLKNKEVLQLFDSLEQDFHIAKPVILCESSLITSPMTFGLFKTYIVLPPHLERWMSINDIKYILMHELHHYKYKDIATNYLMIIFQIIYWFNPLVWIAFGKMKDDREVACDTAVLQLLDKDFHTDYGNAMINFADLNLRAKRFDLTTPFNGSKKQMKKRMESIAFYTKKAKGLKSKSIVIFILASVFVGCQIPFISAMTADNDRYDFNDDHTTYENLSDYFAGYDGSFVLYDMKTNQYNIYNKKQSTYRVSPNSTYKIYSALIGLETGIITSNNSSINWDGTTYAYEAWNKNQDLPAAMRNSVNWYFQKLDQSISQNTIYSYLQEMNYGNYDLSGGENYWLESSLKISPVEQVQLLSAFYTNQFEFEEENIQAVKASLLLEKNGDAKLFGKTGTGKVNGKNINGWFIGYVETNNNTYLFATNIKKEDNSYGSEAAEITLSILKDKSIY